MGANSFGVLFCVTTFGESHGPGLGAVVDGMPAGIALDEALIQHDLDRRRPGRGALVSARDEADRVEILSGVFDGRSSGAPIALLVRNQDAHPADYDELRDLYRPGQADITWAHKYGLRDHRGGGRASGRETVARVAAGAVARQLLATAGIEVAGATVEIGGIDADLTRCGFSTASDDLLRCPDPEASARMREAIAEAVAAGDSLGGVVEVHATGVPPGLGEPVFDKLQARLGAALFSIGAVKGVEFGAGFGAAVLRGSEVNDAILAPLGSANAFASNRAGGILGGLSTGAEIVVRAAVKPTPSFAKAQQTIGTDGQPRSVSVRGRHDPCLVPRLVAVAEAMVCLTLADALLLHRARAGLGLRP